ncbi:camphor resistance protein CrcB [Microterricola gilva]|uniref:Fluoride-specific ion channel FluC n=1 Tax=Microterricola gilva TaxID=393267 RepID=A0A4Q8ANY3_9MICO|nr:fluoride efflux transporter CrcB [Microterricola gilva]RZU65669.1 camphor resistance protein CrcB [Microterricola gilva]
MTPLLFALLALAGGVGAAARFVLDGAIRTRLRTAFPWATTVINVSGSLVLGVLTGLTAVHLLPEQLGVILGAGFLGGYTTFSTASYETVQLIRQGRYGASLLSGLLMLALCVAAAALGLWIGSSV